MRYKDKIYGIVEIREPVLLELLKSSSVLRLKKISQFGIPDKYYHFKNFTRYEHSIGVMILLKKLGATLEEQVAGLLHDVSHLSFSHVGDWVFANGSDGVEDYQDLIHERFIKKTRIPKILKKYSFALDRILDSSNFTLLEKSSPDLCADRIDYALREFKYWLNPKIVGSCTKGLINHNGEMVFSNEKSAFDFAVNYLDLQTIHWGGYQAMVRYHLFSNALKIAIDKKILTEDDFYKDEEFVLNKFEKSKNREIQSTLKLLENKDFKITKKDSGKKIIKKFRYVDPKIVLNGKLKSLSKINSKFQKTLNRHKRINEKGLIV